MTELQIQTSIREYLEAFGWMVILNTQPRQQGARKGRADLTCIGPRGKFMEVEVKGPKGVLSEDQKEYAANLHLRGHIYIVARSVDDVVKGTPCGYSNGHGRMWS